MEYGLNYFEHTLRKCSATGELIAKRRWDFISSINVKRVLDYGCGPSWFRAWRPSNICVDSFDVGNYPQTGINEMEYDLICFWDSLEHIPNLNDIFWLLLRTKYVVVSIPIKPDGIFMKDWKHYRPYEHLHYFSLKTLDGFFVRHGFVNIKQNQNECPPREDIWTVLYESI